MLLTACISWHNHETTVHVLGLPGLQCCYQVLPWTQNTFYILLCCSRIGLIRCSRGMIALHKNTAVPTRHAAATRVTIQKPANCCCGEIPNQPMRPYSILRDKT